MTINNYANHIATLTRTYTDALQYVANEGTQLAAVLVHSGAEGNYYGDDRGVAFQAYGHLLHWIPVNRPNQFIYFRPDEKPIYFQIVPSDFWYEQDISVEPEWEETLTLVKLGSLDELSAELRQHSVSDVAYIGGHADIAASLGINKALINPKRLLAYLDFSRAVKTDYELEQLRAANRLALLGHAAAKACFLEGGSEYQIHMAFLQTTQNLEDECPYTNIVALNEKAAILHYQFKRKTNQNKGRVLLIDAGCRVRAYGSDITRTSVSEDVHSDFRSLVAAMEALELALVDEVKPGETYQSLHASTLRRIAQVLVDHNICKGEVADLVELNIPQLFMPHGVGHLLGIQVHDVGGHQSDIDGAILPPPENSPTLRNTRVMEADMVFTVEPGLYFIPLILEAERGSDRGRLINWNAVDELYPCGGIRIEDNIRVTSDGAENLTRQFE
ncbi:MAG: Xaa-Pro dipeptidase [SAR86 cluster bacterium]|uniref:Xaa-Pro dipeptidase n=1 Tax=SAR86 cluster bacterium TaxID=2030880 RepID=A0A2A4WZ38_9GAMM|nr:MAG: Xaa-Pro dipeptidase [SAR86 cluster bacterium]